MPIGEKKPAISWTSIEYNMNGSNLKVDRKMVLFVHILFFLLVR